MAEQWRMSCIARPAVTFPAAEHHRPVNGNKLYCLVTGAKECEQLAQRCYASMYRLGVKSLTSCSLVWQTPRCKTMRPGEKTRSKRLYLANVFSFVSMLRCRRQSRVSAEPISRVEPTNKLQHGDCIQNEYQRPTLFDEHQGHSPLPSKVGHWQMQRLIISTKIRQNSVSTF